MKGEAEVAIKEIEEKLSKGIPLDNIDLEKLLTLKLIATKNEK